MSEAKEFNLMEAANEILGPAESDSAPTEITETDGQSVENPVETVEDTDPREVLSKLDQDAVSDEGVKAAIEQINRLGAIHNGLPIKVDSPEQLKEIIQKGFDYTKKTMAHAEEVRQKTEQFASQEAKLKETETALAQREQEIQSVVNDNNIITNLLLKWQSSDPELFSFIQSAYQQEANQFKMQQPIVAKYEGQFKQLQDEIQKLKGGKQTEELNSIRQGWEKELGDVQARSASNLAKLGVKVDWEKVKSVWSGDATGKMSVEDALYAAFGKDIVKANQSYQKLLATKSKASAANAQRSGVAIRSKGEQGDVAHRPGDYENLLRGFI